ncbi:MAG TPA: EAL domain-containing protein [Acidiferrobacter sp.]|nr:EAL domain-containing protein [Acidiferrobacter sp.]
MPRSNANLRSKLEFLLAFSNDAVFVLDDQGIIEAVNGEACRILGCGQTALVGTSLRAWRTAASIRPHPDAERPDSLCYSALFKRQTQDTFLGDVSISTVLDGAKRTYIAVLRDMSWYTEAAYKQNLAASVFDNSIQAILITDATNHIITVNPAFERLTGYEATAVIGQSPRLLQSGRHDKAFYAEMWESVRTSGHWEGEIWNKRRNGEIYPEWLTISVIRDEQGAITHHVAICHDITERKQSEERLRHVTDFYSALCQVDQLVARRTDPQTLFDEICQTSIEYGHLKCACITVLGSGTEPVTIAAACTDLSQSDPGPPNDLVLALATSAIESGEATVSHDAGELVSGHGDEAVKVPVGSAGAFPFKRGGRIAGALTVFSSDEDFFDAELLHLLRRIAEDISFALDGFDHETQRRAAESRAHYLARHDILTGLYRRNVVEEVMIEQHAHATQHERSYSLGLIDLDHFKVINDTYGHAVGDEVLVHVAKILRNTVRVGDWVGRWGGEEFLCLLSETSAEAVLYGMDRIRQQLADTPVVVGGHSLRVTASVGVATFPSDGTTIPALMAQVDTALYEAKQQGGNCVRQAGASPSIFLIGGQIEEALASGQILVACQPIVSLDDGAIMADEALARLCLPDGQILEARSFIDAAAHLGQLLRIDQVIIGLTIRRCLNRLAAGCRPLLHFVNASAGLLEQGEVLATLLQDAHLQHQKVAPDDCQEMPFVIEITERAMLRDRKAVQRHLAPLIERGFRVALDDFGSGYSSFLYLADFPVSFLKIEQQLIARIVTEKRVAAIVRDIARLGKDLGMTTIAEGVETPQSADLLRSLGVDWAQGYYFASPAIV